MLSFDLCTHLSKSKFSGFCCFWQRVLIKTCIARRLKLKKIKKGEEITKNTPDLSVIERSRALARNLNSISKYICNFKYIYSYVFMCTCANEHLGTADSKSYNLSNCLLFSAVILHRQSFHIIAVALYCLRCTSEKWNKVNETVASPI